MKKINSVLIVLMFSNLICCQNSKNENENINKIEKVQIKSVDFSIMTIISIECDKFEESFDDYKTVIITDTVIISELLTHIDTLQSIDSTYSRNVNARAKIDLFFKNDTNTICVGNLILEMNNNIYKTPQRLIGFIEEQNTPESMVETVLNPEDWSSQILEPEVGDCFTHSGIMIASSGAESYNTPNQNIVEIDNGIEYLDQQIDQSRSARVHVDRINNAGEGSGRGRHWVAISSRTTDLKSGKTTSFGFFEPGTRHFTLGTSSDNRLNVRQGCLTGPTTYSDKFTYIVTSIRRNK